MSFPSAPAEDPTAVQVVLAFGANFKITYGVVYPVSILVIRTVPTLDRPDERLHDQLVDQSVALAPGPVPKAQPMVALAVNLRLSAHCHYRLSPNSTTRGAPSSNSVYVSQGRHLVVALPSHHRPPLFCRVVHRRIPSSSCHRHPTATPFWSYRSTWIPDAR